MLISPSFTATVMRTTRRLDLRRPITDTLRIQWETPPVLGWPWTSSVRHNSLMNRKGPGPTSRQPYHQMEVALMPDGMEPVSAELGSDRSVPKEPAPSSSRPSRPSLLYDHYVRHLPRPMHSGDPVLGPCICGKDTVPALEPCHCVQ